MDIFFNEQNLNVQILRDAGTLQKHKISPVDQISIS